MAVTWPWVVLLMASMWALAAQPYPMIPTLYFFMIRWVDALKWEVTCQYRVSMRLFRCFSI